MHSREQYWIKISFINLLIVSAIGIILRYKIDFSLPFIDQKYLLHGHSHFAFSGWVSQIIMTLLVSNLSEQTGRNEFNKYKWLLYANLLTAYGMLLSFPFQGYGLYSIIFSTLSIFVSYAFAVYFWKDLRRLRQKKVAHLWFKASLIFNALSSLGAFSLAFMMANKIIHQNWYLAAVYFFLHFQYNGWFFFACMGFFFYRLEKHTAENLITIFWLFAIACVPAYFLSALWMPIPKWVYICVVVSALIQVIAWFWLLSRILKNLRTIYTPLPSLSKYLLALSAFALTIKLFLQAGSTIPSLSQLAFGFRPIVVGYLHLVLLGVITIFILGYILSLKLFPVTKIIIAGCLIFTTGIILNEIALMTQGIAALSYDSLPYINHILLGLAILLFLGIATIVFGLFKGTSAVAQKL